MPANFHKKVKLASVHRECSINEACLRGIAAFFELPLPEGLQEAENA